MRKSFVAVASCLALAPAAEAAAETYPTGGAPIAAHTEFSGGVGMPENNTHNVSNSPNIQVAASHFIHKLAAQIESAKGMGEPKKPSTLDKMRYEEFEVAGLPTGSGSNRGFYDFQVSYTGFTNKKAPSVPATGGIVRMKLVEGVKPPGGQETDYTTIYAETTDKPARNSFLEVTEIKGGKTVNFTETSDHREGIRRLSQTSLHNIEVVMCTMVEHGQEHAPVRYEPLARG